MSAETRLAFQCVIDLCGSDNEKGRVFDGNQAMLHTLAAVTHQYHGGDQLIFYLRETLKNLES